MITPEQPETSYKIDNRPASTGTVCECGHTVSAHGSNGMMCAACSCKQFKEKK